VLSTSTYNDDSCSQAYDCLLLQLEESRYQPEIYAYLANYVERNPVNNELLTVIGSGATSVFVVIEFKYDGFPVETAWTVRESTGPFIADHC
jgi:hypothetical protein